MCRVATNRPLFHVTFDDGPHPQVTPRILDVLAEFNAPATFFVLVEHARRYRHVLEEMLSRGHVVGLHGRTHLRLSRASSSEITDEVGSARRELEALISQRVRLFRPPYGDHGWRSLAFARSVGLRTVLWSVDTYDWQGIPSDASLDPVLDRVEPGGIGLFHDTPIGKTIEEEAARGYIPRDQVAKRLFSSISERGFRFVSLEGLLASGPAQRRFRPLDWTGPLR